MTTQSETQISGSSQQHKKSFHAWHIERAKQLEKARIVYALYGALDGLSLSYSTIKYAFDVLCANSKCSSSDAMHEWLTTPGGALAAASEAVVIIGFSLLGNYLSYKESDKEKYKAFRKYITLLWPYCRDSLKGLKNAQKGVRSALQIAGVFAGQDLSFLILPVGILLGGISVANRIWYRSVRNERKDINKDYKKDLEEIQAIKISASGDEAQLDGYKTKLKKLEARIKAQQDKKSIAVLSQLYSGFIDGLYLYMGIIGVANLAPPVFIALSVFCVLFTIAGIAGRIHEENEEQRELKANQIKAELALCGKELERLFNQLQSDYIDKTNTSTTILVEDYQKTCKKLNDKLEEFAKKRIALNETLNLSNSQAALAGLKDGLAAYSVICSAMFAVATIYAMCFAAFPPAFVIMAVALGMVCLVGFTAHAVIKNHYHLNHIKYQQEEKDNFSDIYNRVKAAIGSSDSVEISDSKHIINEGLALDVSPQFFFQEWFEVVRSFFSGIGKGQKSVDYALNVLQERDETGHYHDTPIMFGLACVSAVVFAIALSLRAYTRGFNKKELADDNKLILIKENKDVSKDVSKDEKPTSCQDSGESDEKKKCSGSQSSSLFGSIFNFFSSSKSPSNPNKQSQSPQEPTQPPPFDANTAQDLTPGRYTSSAGGII